MLRNRKLPQKKKEKHIAILKLGLLLCILFSGMSFAFNSAFAAIVINKGTKSIQPNRSVEIDGNSIVVLKKNGIIIDSQKIKI